MRTREISPNRVRIDSYPQRGGVEQRPGLDKNLTIFRDGISWKFSEGKVLVGGLDVARILQNNPEDMGYWMGLAEGLNEYRQRVLKNAKDEEQVSKFGAVVEGLLGKIFGKVKKVYDQKMSGISWKVDDGQLVLNGIKISSFLALYRLRKTEKAKKFLMGLRGKLSILMGNRQGPDYERIRPMVEDLHQQIEAELAGEASASASPRLLTDGSSSF